MADNAQKTSLGLSLNRNAKGVAENAIALLGRSLPASVAKVMGAIFQVKFEISGETIPSVAIPGIGSRYARPPIQAGEKGVTIAADAYLGGMSGMGGGVADLSTPANLTALVWAPIGSADWPSVDPDTHVLSGGSNGILLRDSESGGATVTIMSGEIVLKVGGSTITLNGSGVAIVGTLTANGHDVGSTHLHTAVQTGTSDSGPPV